MESKKMTAEQLAMFMMHEWREVDFVIPPWDEFSEKAKRDAIRVAQKILDQLESKN